MFNLSNFWGSLHRPVFSPFYYLCDCKKTDKLASPLAAPSVWPLRSLNETFKPWSTLSGKQKHRTSSMKTSVLLRQNIRTFAQRSPMFYSFRTATSHSPFPPLQKKVFENLLHFLHHTPRCPVFTNDFG